MNRTAEASLNSPLWRACTDSASSGSLAGGGPPRAAHGKAALFARAVRCYVQRASFLLLRKPF